MTRRLNLADSCALALVSLACNAQSRHDRATHHTDYAATPVYRSANRDILHQRLKVMRDGTLTARLRDLETHLERENPILLKVVRRFRELDRVGYQLGVLKPDES